MNTPRMRNSRGFLNVQSVFCSKEKYLVDKRIISIPFKKEKVTLNEIGKIAIFIIPILMLVFFMIINRGDVTSDQLGTFGDFIGGIANPIFGFLSFITLLYTIMLQSKELELTRQELEETKEELKRSAEAQELSSQVFQQQKFDSIFFSLIDQINKSTDTYIKKNYDAEGKNKFLEKIRTYQLDNHITIWQVYESSKESRRIFELLVNQERKTLLTFTQLSVLIYQTLKLIKNSSISNKKFYTNILRSSLNQDILFTLAINCCRKDINMDKYKKLLEDYAFFEHMPFKLSSEDGYSMILAFLLLNYEASAFGDSEYKKELDEYIASKIEEDKKNRLSKGYYETLEYDLQP